MTYIAMLFTRRCCGGPTLALTLFCSFFGVLFMLLSATSLGVVFLLTGSATLGLCLALGQKRCRNMQTHLTQ